MSSPSIELSQLLVKLVIITVEFLQFLGYILARKKGVDSMSGFNRIDTTANRLKIAMEQAGMRQSDLAREAEVDKGAMSHYLKGKYEPKQDVIYKLALALNVSEMWLWGYDCKKERSEGIAEIKKNPAAAAEQDCEILMDEDFVGMFSEFKRLDAKKRKIVKDLVHNLAETEA